MNFSATTIEAVQRIQSLGDLITIGNEIETLVIAPNYEPILESLSTAFTNESCAIFVLSPDTTFSDSQLRSAINQLVASGQLSHLILTGCPDELAGTVNEQDSIPLPAGMDEVGNRLLDGARSQNTANQQIQERFLAEIQAFIENLVTAGSSRQEQTTPRVSGLLYRPCDGIFLLYDPAMDQFRPLA